MRNHHSRIPVDLLERAGKGTAPLVSEVTGVRTALEGLQVPPDAWGGVTRSIMLASACESFETGMLGRLGALAEDLADYAAGLQQVAADTRATEAEAATTIAEAAVPGTEWRRPGETVRITR